MDIFINILMTLISAGFISTLITYFINKGKQQKIIEKHEIDINKLKRNHDKMKENINRIEKGTSIRLAKIETQISAIQIQQVEIAKDVKLILKQGIYRGE